MQLKNLKIFLKWIFGILCFIFAIFAFKNTIIGGLLFLISGIFLIPPLFKAVNKKEKISHPIKILTPVFAVLIAFAFVGMKSSEKAKNISQPEQGNESNNRESKTVSKSVEENEQKRINEENVFVFNTDSKEVVSEIVNWNSKFEKSDIIGDWMQIQYYYSNDKSDITNIPEKDKEQKQLTLTSTKYKTSYPYGSGDNNPWIYKFSGNYLSVQTANTNQEIYGFTIKLADDKSKLLLKEKSGLIQIFEKKR